MKRISYLLSIMILVMVIIPLVVLVCSGQGERKNVSSIAAAEIPDSAKGQVENHTGKQAESQDTDKELKINVYEAEKDKLVEMDLEEYIAGVVSGEMPAEFDMEALKAQSVAARTYAVTRMKEFGGKGCSKKEGADICTDSAHCQEWISKEDRLKSWSSLNAAKYWDKITKAVESTKGLILIYDAQPVMYPLFFSTSSGKTENSKDYFRFQQPYLKSVVSPNEEESPKFITQISFSLDILIKKIYGSQYKIKLVKSKLKDQFKIISRTEGGSVKEIQVGAKILSGRDIRQILALNSANFTFVIGKNSIRFTVTGNGHGVGMSQWGANEMGKRGNNYEEILKHYYQGTEIKKISDVYFKIGKQ